jgi:Protein of unknown function (DUF3667)
MAVIMLLDEQPRAQHYAGEAPDRPRFREFLMSNPAIPAGAIAIPVENTPALPAAAAPGACASCGGALLGEFCHACGERRLRPDEMTLRAFARDVASEVGDLDSRAYRSVRALIRQPGFLTAEWVAGRRRAYLSPLKLFLAAFAVIMLASSLLSRPATAEAAQTIDGSWMGAFVDGLASRLGASRAETLERLNATALGHLSWLSLLIPVVLAGVLALVFLRRRRGYVEHLVFATHVATFNFVLGLFAMATQPLAETNAAIGVPLMTALILGVMWFYLWRAVARVYGDARWRGGVRAAVLVLGFSLAQSIASLLSIVTAALALLYL